jgi:hypothetical protein
MATIQEKIVALEEARKNVEAFVDGGGDLKSKEAVPVGMTLLRAYDALAKEFGDGIIKPVVKRPDFMQPDPSSR